MATKLKFKPRKGIFSNHSGTCTYNPADKNGYSYRCWRVCGVVLGIPVFNCYSYSVTTSGHQSRIASLFYKEFPEGSIVRVKAPKGLLDGLSILEQLRAERADLLNEIDEGKEGTRAQKWRQQRLAEVEKGIRLFVPATRAKLAAEKAKITRYRKAAAIEATRAKLAAEKAKITRYRKAAAIEAVRPFTPFIAVIPQNQESEENHA